MNYLMKQLEMMSTAMGNERKLVVAYLRHLVDECDPHADAVTALNDAATAIEANEHGAFADRELAERAARGVN